MSELSDEKLAILLDKYSKAQLTSDEMDCLEEWASKEHNNRLVLTLLTCDNQTVNDVTDMYLFDKEGTWNAINKRLGYRYLIKEVAIKSAIAAAIIFTFVLFANSNSNEKVDNNTPHEIDIEKIETLAMTNSSYHVSTTY